MKKRAAPVIHLGESYFPSDLLTPTTADNYGLDGFPDMQYGIGTLEGVLNERVKSPSEFPQGIHLASDEAMDLSSLSEGGYQNLELVDLDWLDPSQMPDPDRNPNHPSLNVIPELVEAWGAHRVTDGVHQKDLSYVKAMEGEEGAKPKASKKALLSVATHAMRRSIEGQHIDRIVKEAAESMGEALPQIAPLLKEVQAEHGLVGNVYIRTSAYPGWGAGKWRGHAKKYASRARYILVTEHDLKQATWIQNGRCMYTGKLAVTEIPWKQAYRHYAPRLQGAGIKVASGDPRAALRAAFLSQPERTLVADGAFLPKHKTPDQYITQEAARKAFDAYQPVQVVLDPTVQINLRKMAKVTDFLSRLEQNNLLPPGERTRILASGQDPAVMVREASRLVAQVKEGTYQGDTRTVEAQAKRATDDLLREATEWAKVAESVESWNSRHSSAAILEQQRQKAIQHLTKLAYMGLVSEEELTHIFNSKQEAVGMVRAAAQLVARVRSTLYEGDTRNVKATAHLKMQGLERESKVWERVASNVESYNKIRADAAIKGWVAKGFVTASDVQGLTDKHKDVRKVAMLLVDRVVAKLAQKGEYQGTRMHHVGNGLEKISPEEIRRELQASMMSLQSKNKLLEKVAQEREYAKTRKAKEEAQLRGLVAKVEQEIARGARGSHLRAFIARTIPEGQAKAAVKLLAPLLTKTGALEESSKQTRVYDQPVFTRQASDVKSRNVLAGQIKLAAAWVRKTMSEGFAGKDLDSMIEHRFASSLREAAKEEIQQARVAHEGLSGFLYVDSEVYASQSGSTGCEKGGLKHRANPIPNVMAMSRCASCALVRTLPDGSKKCGAYNKVLVNPEDVTGPEFDAIRQRNVTARDMTDAERTANLFAPVFDPSQFDLQNNALESFDINELPASEKLGSILFDDWVI